MFQKLHYHQQACTLLYTRTFLGWHLPIFGPYVPRVCCVIPSPILLVRTSFHTVFSCDNNSVFITLHSEHQQIFWWDVSQHDETHHTPLFWQQVQYTSCCIEATSTLYIRDGPPITMHPCGSGGRGGVKSDHPTIASEPAVSRCSSALTGTAYQVYV